jgi:MFS family permease
VVGVVGPPLGGFLAGVYGFKIMLIGAAIFYSSAAGLRVWMARTMSAPSDDGNPPLSLDSFKKSLALIGSMIVGGGVITWIFLTDGVRDIAFRMSEQLQPLYLEQVMDLSLQQIGLLGSFFSFAMMLTPILSGRIADRYGERVPISGGFFVIFIALVVFLQARTYPAFILTWALFGSGVGLLSPAYQSLISKVVPRRSLGTFTGIFHSSLGFISLPAPWLGAQLWERFTPRLPFMITAAVVLATILPSWFKFKLPKTPVVEPESVVENI